MTGPRPRVLLVCPEFFSYHRSIAAELERLGYTVTWWSDRPSMASAYKLLLRLFPRQVAPYARRHYERLLREIAEREHFVEVLVIKGESLSRGIVEALRAAFANARFSYYTWDGLGNVRGALEFVSLFDSVATFDPLDARTHGWKHRPLFARDDSPLADSTTGSAEELRSQPRYDWAFVGSLHSDRYKVVWRLARRSRSGRFYAFMYVPGRLAWVLRHLVDWRMWFPGSITLSRVPLAADEARLAIAAARVVVDIEHPRQRGLTMRTIEALIAGHKLATTNVHIRTSDLFDPRRVCIIDRRKPLIPESFLAADVVPPEPAIRARYSLRHWLGDLLGAPLRVPSPLGDDQRP